MLITVKSVIISQLILVQFILNTKIKRYNGLSFHNITSVSHLDYHMHYPTCCTTMLANIIQPVVQPCWPTLSNLLYNHVGQHYSTCCTTMLANIIQPVVQPCWPTLFAPRAHAAKPSCPTLVERIEFTYLSNLQGHMCIFHNLKNRNTTHRSGQPATDVGCEVVQHSHTLSKMLFYISPRPYKIKTSHILSNQTNLNLVVQPAHTLTKIYATRPSCTTGWIVYGSLKTQKISHRKVLSASTILVTRLWR